MRRSLSKLSHCSIGQPPASISSAFSTFSGGGGGGRGRGRGSDFPNFGFSPGKTETNDSKPESEPEPAPPGIGHGRGRGGKPFPSSPILPSFSSFNPNPNTNPPAGRGRGGIGAFYPPPPQPPPHQQQQQQPPPLRKPIFFTKEEEKVDSNSNSSKDPNIRSGIISVLSGAAEGKPVQTASPVTEKPKEENRHLRVRQQQKAAPAEPGERASSPPKLSREDAVKKAVGILSRSDDGGDAGGGGRGMGMGGFRGRGDGGRGAMRGRGGRGRGRGRGRGYRRDEESGDGSLESGFYLGDDADGEKLATKLGPETMNTLAEGFEEMSARVLPSPMDDAYVEALHTNMMIECEPEYLIGDFESNPDIDETPPIPLRDALEKMKPFLMAYEGIKDQQEWEEAIKETMETVPLMKEIVDYYSGPDRVTAKQQQQELERVAKTLPESAPNSVKRFTERALLSLQSNPGWGFDKKCQFMDKVLLEVSQHYK